MKVKEMRELSVSELTEKTKQTRQEIVELRFAHATRKLESPAKLQQARKRLARLLTVVTQLQQ